MRKTPETGKCSLCLGRFVRWGNNPEPLARFEDRCCDDCNATKVIPARILNLRLKEGRPVSLGDIFRDPKDWLK